MAVQAQTTHENIPFTMGNAIGEQAIIAQDAARAIPLKSKTLMGKKAADRKWIPLTAADATDGSAETLGIYVGEDIEAVDLVAGDVEAKIIKGGSPLFFDLNQLVIENALTLETTIGTGVSIDTVQGKLEKAGMYAELAENIFR